ncbi:uncharacterized protein PHACADRAFT_128546 [Phanerochaete carnosa HHB-10118-sp]|uniref:Cytochrome P450 n=1 Tax=Phanerochaete carnosa (strain HHB-10118-sp) TaxID=650164 RepID=K5VI37_PHACS|nr:uncharacterized protein PHACADRAFT_128546 [Phanerochaete carnosa HHB-10118-sp]EKM50918.1 hypothetical protein PHACADRAFT_128546 [Phanerochaete carnosa HHB-10118-sp]
MLTAFQDLQTGLRDHPFLLLPICTAIWVLYAACRSKYSVESLPVPPGASWIFGHEGEVVKNAPGRIFREWADKLGLTYRIKAAFGARDVLVLCDPAGIAHILQKKVYDYHHSRVVRPRIGRLLGKGLGWVEGEVEHKRMRHLISPSLSHENMKEMESDVRVAAMQVIDNFTHEVHASNNKKWVNLFDVTGKATLTIIGRVAFLHDFEGGESEDARKILEARRIGVSPAIKSSSLIMFMLLRRFPILNDLPIPALQVQGLAREIIQSGVAHEMIRRNEDVVEGVDPKSHNDLLSRLLIAHSAGQISTEELYAQISTFIITGNETSTQTLAFMIWELARHPDVQERLRKELKAFPGEPNYDDFQAKLPYLDAVMRESLRLYPGLPYMERVATKEDVIPLREPVKLSNGKVVSELPISPGQVVLIPILSFQRMDSVYEDGETFRPERWLDGSVDTSTRQFSGWGHMLAFSDGPRNCIGTRLGLLQMKVILTYMMERFRFVDTHEDVTFKISSSLQAWVADKPELGPCLPVRVELL